MIRKAPCAALVALAVGLAACSGGASSPMGATPPPRTGGTSIAAPNVYQVDGDADFAISSSFADSYLFSWSDAGGTFTDVPDPTLRLRAGSAYTFRLTVPDHAMVITTSGLPVQGADGAFLRTTVDGAEIDALTLTPTADFTADPAPSTDVIRWTPSAAEVGDYFYTCRVLLHTPMTGAITVRPAGS